MPCEFASKIVKSEASTVCIGLLDKGVRFKGRDFVEYRKNVHLVLKSSRGLISQCGLGISKQDLRRKIIFISDASEVSRDLYVDAIEALTLSNTPDVFGLHPNAEIGYYTHSAKDMWNHLVELQPQTGGEAGGVSREEFIGKIATDIQGKLPPLFDVDRVRKSISEITPTYVVLLQELDRFNVLIRKMSTSLINLQRVGYLTPLFFPFKALFP